MITDNRSLKCSWAHVVILVKECQVVFVDLITKWQWYNVQMFISLFCSVPTYSRLVLKNPWCRNLKWSSHSYVWQKPSVLFYEYFHLTLGKQRFVEKKKGLQLATNRKRRLPLSTEQATLQTFSQPWEPPRDHQFLFWNQLSLQLRFPNTQS